MSDQVITVAEQPQPVPTTPFFSNKQSHIVVVDLSAEDFDSLSVESQNAEVVEAIGNAFANLTNQIDAGEVDFDKPLRSIVVGKPHTDNNTQKKLVTIVFSFDN